MPTRILSSGCWLGLWSIAFLATARAQSAASADKKLAPKGDSLPLWTEASEADVLDLSQVVRRIQGSIFIVGNADNGYGTAFVISKEHRLLATNAHVADVFHASGGEMSAIPNGSAKVWTVDDAYYHPGVRRTTGGMTVRASEPAVGEVMPRSPDVAVLRLAEGEELPEALPLATPEELADLFAKPVGMLGFPGHDTESWPGAGQKAAATFRQGVVVRISDFMNDVNVDADRQQFVQHSMASWFGFSGSPIFLANGHVVVLNNSGRTEQKGGASASLSFGVRADCLLELLKYNELADEVAPDMDLASVDVERFKEPDKEAEALNKVYELLADAELASLRGRDADAVRKCNEAVKLLPNFAVSYAMRAKCYNQYAITHTETGSKENRNYLELAFNDSLKSMTLDPTVAQYYLDAAWGRYGLILADAEEGYPEAPEVVELMNKILEQPGLDPSDMASAYCLRARGRGFVADTLEDLKKAAELDPWSDAVPWELQFYWENQGDEEAAARALEISQRLQAASADNVEAWRLATSPDDSERDGLKARDLAAKACEATGYECADYLDTLAAAHAELGDFDKAIEWIEKALELATEQQKPAGRAHLRSFKEGKPIRED